MDRPKTYNLSQQRYRLKNKDRINAKSRDRYQRIKVERAEYARQYYAKNADSIKKQQKDYRARTTRVRKKPLPQE